MSSLLISLASLKGGVGKTTSAVHIAGQLAKRDIGGVAVVDRDRTRSATSWSRGGKLPFFVGTQDAVMRRAVDFSALVIDSRGGLENDELLEMAEASDFLLLPTNVEYMSLDAMAQTAEALGENPFPHGVEKLSGSENAYRIRLGDYRVVYNVFRELKLVEIQRVRHRKDVYRG